MIMSTEGRPPDQLEDEEEDRCNSCPKRDECESNREDVPEYVKELECLTSEDGIEMPASARIALNQSLVDAMKGINTVEVGLINSVATTVLFAKKGEERERAIRAFTSFVDNVEERITRVCRRLRDGMVDESSEIYKQRWMTDIIRRVEVLEKEGTERYEAYLRAADELIEDVDRRAEFKGRIHAVQAQAVIGQLLGTELGDALSRILGL